jgi:D-arabinose 1-dehydrogenase-like Zn-dependent alcohol dehydrogenase
VTDLEPGGHVIGVGIGGGAFAEYMALPAAAAVPVPAGWADEQALGLVVNWPTALAALKPLGRIAAGQTVTPSGGPPGFSRNIVEALSAVRHPRAETGRRDPKPPDPLRNQA